MTKEIRRSQDPLSRLSNSAKKLNEVSDEMNSKLQWYQNQVQQMNVGIPFFSRPLVYHERKTDDLGNMYRNVYRFGWDKLDDFWGFVVVSDYTDDSSPISYIDDPHALLQLRTNMLPFSLLNASRELRLLALVGMEQFIKDYSKFVDELLPRFLETKEIRLASGTK